MIDIDTEEQYEAALKVLEQVLESASGEPFIIAKAGKPIARVSTISSPEPGAERRLGFLRGQIQVPCIGV